MTDLTKIRMHRQLQNINLSKDPLSIKTANDEQTTIIEHRTMIAPSGRGCTIDFPLVPRHSHEIQEEHVGGIGDSIVATDDEEVGADERSSVGEAGWGEGFRRGCGAGG